MSGEPGRYGSRLFDACVAVLLAAMALYGAVQVITAIWVPLCLTIFFMAIVGISVWYFFIRSRRW